MDKEPLTRLLEDKEWVTTTLAITRLTGENICVVACKRVDWDRYNRNVLQDSLDFYLMLTKMMTWEGTNDA